MRSRLFIPALALALTGVITSCDGATGIDENFRDDATWTTTMNGANERPNPVTTPATGRAWFIDRGNSIDYYMEYSGLTSTAINAHIHRIPATEPGPVMVQLTFVRQQGAVVLGTIDMTVADISAEAGTQPPSELRTLLDNGGTYVNVHSTTNPGGEIRGTITRR
jgi:hypothetical protein